MRKRISCKVIKSIPLDASDNRLRQDFSANLRSPKINVGTSTYTHRLVITTTSIDENSLAQFLDCRA